MDYILTTSNLCKRYGAVNVLNNISIHVEKGAIYGLIGKNGAGKTTLIRVICGLQYPTCGEYSIFGVKNSDREIGSMRRRMGAIVDSPAIYLNMTAEENIKQQYCILGRPNFDGIDELLDMVGLSDVKKKKASHFSLGMRQRLGIALVLCGDPDLILLDEPTNGIDPQGIIQIREMLIRLNRDKQITIIISSHILGELSKMATHYGFIDKGSIIKEITAAEIEHSCRKCMSVKVSDMTSLIKVMDAGGMEYRITSGNTADIYGEHNITDMAVALKNEGCNILGLSERDETLESYYINLIGGGKNV